MPQVLGVHNALPINQIAWSSPVTPPGGAPQNFEDWWNPNVPVFVGRYFGPADTAHAWKTGESHLNPPDQFLRYVAAFQAVTGPTVKAMQSGDAARATADAIFTIACLANAIGGGTDLAMSASKLVYVFLDVEDLPGNALALSPYYWNAWAAVVCQCVLYLNGVPFSQPFRPGIYCYTTSAPQGYVPDQGVQDALAGKDPNNPNAAPIPTAPCYAFWYCKPRGDNVPTATLPVGEVVGIDVQHLTVANLANCSSHFPVYKQNSAVNPAVSLDVPVEAWQFGGNIPFAAGQVMDLDFTLAANATDHMAQMP